MSNQKDDHGELQQNAPERKKASPVFPIVMTLIWVAVLAGYYLYTKYK